MTAQSSSTSQAPLRSGHRPPLHCIGARAEQTAPSSRQSSGSSHAPATHTRAPLHSRESVHSDGSAHILISTSHRPSPKQSSSEEHIPHRPSIHRGRLGSNAAHSALSAQPSVQAASTQICPHYTVGRSRRDLLLRNHQSHRRQVLARTCSRAPHPWAWAWHPSDHPCLRHHRSHYRWVPPPRLELSMVLSPRCRSQRPIEQ